MKTLEDYHLQIKYIKFKELQNSSFFILKFSKKVTKFLNYIKKILY